MSRSLEAEQHIIACALIDQTKTAELLELDENWFPTNAHKIIIRTIRELVSNNLGVDVFSIGTELQRLNQLEMAGGMDYLIELTESLPNLKFWDSYKRSLFESYKMASIEQIKFNMEMQIGTGANPAEIIESLQSSIIDLLTDHHQGGFKKVGDYLGEVIDEIEWREQNKGQLLGQKTGFNELDYTLDGFQDGRVYVIAGRPGSGKSAFGLAICEGLTENGKPWFYFSLEMTGKSLAKRMVVKQSGVHNYKFRAGNIKGDDYTQVANAIGVIQDISFHVDQTPSLSIAQIRSRLKAAQVRTGKIGGVVIDHIGLIRKDAKKGDTEAMNIIADELLVIAKEFDCPMIELCQLNRGVESRSDRRPMMSDLKQSGKIEENADVVMLLYRGDYYDKNESPITELNTAKNRDGETKIHYLKHDMALGKYEELVDYEPPKQQKKGKF